MFRDNQIARLNYQCKQIEAYTYRNEKYSEQILFFYEIY